LLIFIRPYDWNAWVLGLIGLDRGAILFGRSAAMKAAAFEAEGAQKPPNTGSVKG
jgi:hypothetical protein